MKPGEILPRRVPTISAKGPRKESLVGGKTQCGLYHGNNAESSRFGFPVYSEVSPSPLHHADRDGGIYQRGFRAPSDLHGGVLRVGLGVGGLGLEGMGGVWDVGGCFCAGGLEGRVRRLEGILGGVRGELHGPGLASSMLRDEIKINTDTTGLQRNGLYKCESKVTMRNEGDASASPLGIPKSRLRRGEAGMGNAKNGKKGVTFQEYLPLPSLPSEASKATTGNSLSATVYGGVRFSPIIRGQSAFPASLAPVSAVEPAGRVVERIQQPDYTSPFDLPAEPRRLFRRRYGGGYPDGYIRDRDERPCPTFPTRILWNTDGVAVPPPDFPPSRASHFRQPTVTEEAEEDVVDVVGDLPDLSIDSAISSLDTGVARHRDGMSRLQPDGSRLELGRTLTVDLEVPLRYGRLGMGRGRRDSRSNPYERRVETGNHDLIADRCTRTYATTLADERVDTAFCGSADDLSLGKAFASGALQLTEEERDGRGEWSATVGLHRRPLG